MAFPGFGQKASGSPTLRPTWDSHHRMGLIDPFRAPSPAVQHSSGVTRSERALNLASQCLVVFLALLHIGRLNECASRRWISFAPLQQLDWVCSDDVFSQATFWPMHFLSASALAIWAVLVVRDRCGVRRAAALPSGLPHQIPRASALRALEILLACYALCWFTTPGVAGAIAEALPALSHANCTDNDAKCQMWAASGECEKNRPWMELTCKLSCHFCAVPPTAEGNLPPHQAHRRRLASLLQLPALALEPRALSVVAGGSLLFLAASRLLSLAELSLGALRLLAMLLLRLVRLVLSCMLRLHLLRHFATCCLRGSNCCRRRLIRVLGGKIDDLPDFGPEPTTPSTLPRSSCYDSHPHSGGGGGHIGMLQPMVAGLHSRGLNFDAAKRE
jgi:hypothetical protein